MKVSTYTRNAVNCTIYLATHKHGQLVSLPSIAASQAVSAAYLEQIFAKLRRAGLVSAIRGPGGGYRLAKDAANITVADIMLAVDDGVETTGCGGSENCKSGTKCLSHDLWGWLNKRISSYLEDVTLGHLVARAKGENVTFPVGR